ncbi:MAG: energy-coupling factor transporter transmembrane protein EcfT [Clostridia bacterium]|nr:energy-coupling factor transporter transmembrane protein EcfT [Clostridia bacterium]
MLKDVTLGQFFPGNSILHRIDPRMKLLISFMFIAMIFGASTLLTLLVVATLTFLLPIIGKIPMKTMIKGIKPLRWVVLIMTVIFIINGEGEGYHVIFEWKFITISWEGIIKAFCVSIRIVVLVASVSVLLSYTTSPIALADAIEHLLAPLKYVKVPVHDFAMMITIAMRFIPILIEETDKIMSAQASRGADFKNGSLIKRAKALIPVFIPLFISSVRHADNLATAMECRCYHGGKGRTRMKRLRYQVSDFAAFLVMALFLVGVAVASAELSASVIGIMGFVYA